MDAVELTGRGVYCQIAVLGASILRLSSRKSGGETDRDPPHVQGVKPWMDRTDATLIGCFSP